MGYEDEKEEEALRKRAEIIEDLGKKLQVCLQQAIANYFVGRRAYDEERRDLDRKGLGTGVDLALEAVARDLTFELLKEDKKLRAEFKAYILRTFKDQLLPQFASKPGSVTISAIPDGAPAPVRGKAT